MKNFLKKGLAFTAAFMVVAASVFALAKTTTNAASSGVTIYFENTQSWSDVYCYTFYGSGAVGTAWPGMKMTKVSGTTDWYECTYTQDKALNPVFNDNNGNQTANVTPGDLDVTSQKVYWFVPSASTSQNAGGMGGGANVTVSTTAQAGWPQPTSTSSTSSKTSSTSSTSSKTASATTDSSPKTGDTNAMPLFAGVIGAAALGGLAVLYAKKKVKA